MKCEIRWVDECGRDTADTNEAIGTVYREEYTTNNAYAFGGVMQHPRTKKYAICADHAERLNDRGMHHWVFEASEVSA